MEIDRVHTIKTCIYHGPLKVKGREADQSTQGDGIFMDKLQLQSISVCACLSVSVPACHRWGPHTDTLQVTVRPVSCL